MPLLSMTLQSQLRIRMVLPLTLRQIIQRLPYSHTAGPPAVGTVGTVDAFDVHADATFPGTAAATDLPAAGKTYYIDLGGIAVAAFGETWCYRRCKCGSESLSKQGQKR